MNDDEFTLTRNNKQYVDIENFKEYEFRTCIAYELAIRNKEVIEFITNGFTEYIEMDINEEMKEPTLQELGAMKYSGKYFKKLRDTYFMPQALYLKYHFFSDVWEEIETLINQHEAYYKRLKEIVQDMQMENRCLTEEEEKFCKNKKDIKMLVSLIFDNKEFNSKNFMYGDGKVCNTINRRTSLFSEALYHVEDGREEKITAQLIEPNFSRPKLISFKKTVERDIRVNLELPTKEIISFIEELKKEFKNNRETFLNIEQLFNSSTKEKGNITYGKKRVADMLFIYDYITHEIICVPNDNPKAILLAHKEKLESVLNKKIDGIIKDYYLIEKIINNCEYKKII